jgi:thiol:disulfide interchange protein
MKKYFMVALLAALVGCGRNETTTSSSPTTEADGVLKWESSYQAALVRAKAEKKLVMVDVYTDWCGWCKRLDRDVYANPSVAAKLASGFVVVKLNPEKTKEAAEVSRQFGTRGFPHIVFVNGDGKKVNEISGYVPADEFGKRLDSLVAAK